MKHYVVTVLIEVDANSAEQAIGQALRIIDAGGQSGGMDAHMVPPRLTEWQPEPLITLGEMLAMSAKAQKGKAV